MQQYLKIVGNGQRTARNLTPDEAETAFTLVMEGRASQTQVAAFMAALRIKEESTEELASFGRVLRQYCQLIPTPSPYLVDICVPYDGRSRRPSVIPLAALIAASAGASVALHGRRGQNTPPKFGVGIGDILAALGVPTTTPINGAAVMLRDHSLGVTYVDVVQFAPALERFNSVRFDYGMRSFFNTLEKLINPFNAPNSIVGVFHGAVLERVAGAMQSLGYKHGIVVQGSEGAIDVLTSRRTPIIEFAAHHHADFQSWGVDPNDYDWWDRADGAENPEIPLTAAGNAALTLQLLNPIADRSTLSAFQHSALLTAALIVYASGKQTTFDAALTMVEAAYQSGEVAKRFARWQACLSDSIHPAANGEANHAR